MTSSFTRRKFLELVPTILAAAPAFVSDISGGAAPGWARADLAGVFGSQMASAIAIGRRYLDACAVECDSDLLVDAWFSQVPGIRGGAETGAHDLIAFFQDRFADDFERGDTVTVDGWVLSRSEARLCALCALS